jgi:hypothetical protein
LEIENETFGTAVLAAATVALCACSTIPADAQCGKASWYALHSKTASGEMMNPAQMTAAHRTLPFGTRVKVTNADRQIGRGAHQRSRTVHQGPHHRPVEGGGEPDRHGAVRPCAGVHRTDGLDEHADMKKPA